MRQRNDSGSVLHVSAWPTDLEPDRAPFDVGPGEEIDFPELLAGFTGIEPAQDPQLSEGAAKPKTRGKNADASGEQGGEGA